jgi:3'-phosphoadenosine 5'-phosphosulfate sulfotransferase (PAPS reductase)/FAD synthetase
VVTRRVGGRPQSLLEQVEARGMWPDAARRYCTSDNKRSPIRALMTRIAAEHRAAGVTGPVRILSVMGMRAEESRARARRPPFRHDGARTCPCTPCRQLPPDKRGHGASNTRRHVDEWLPVHHYTTAQIWDRVRAAGTRPHWAYQDMPRLSCRFCVLASKAALIRSAQLNPALAAEYAAVEARIGHRFRKDLSMAEVIDLAKTTPAPDAVDDWTG